MSDIYDEAKRTMKERADRLTSKPKDYVDGSDYSPHDCGEEEKDYRRKAYKKGGRVEGHVEGKSTKSRGDRKPREKKALGGMNVGPDNGAFVDPRVAATQAMAGAAARSGVGPDRMQFGAAKPGLLARSSGMLKHGGKAEKHHEEREARKSGGRAKGKTNINIVIATGKGKDDQAPPNAAGLPPNGPMPASPMPMPPGGAPPMPGGPGGPQIPPASMMGRKAGGRIPHLTSGAASGEGRIEKNEHFVKSYKGR